MADSPTQGTNLRLARLDESASALAPGSKADGRTWRPGLLATVPNWFLSLGLHAALFAVLAASMPSLRGGIVGDPDGDYRSVGIWVGHSGDGIDGNGVDASPGKPNKSQTSAETKVTTTEIKTTPAPPAPLPTTPAPALPTTTPTPVAPRVVSDQPSRSPEPSATPASPILGPGERPARPGLFQPNAPPSASSGKSGNGTGSGSGRGGSRGTAPFFGIVDVGSRFVYVIDCSGSMYGHDAMGAAKRELNRSLRSLNRLQQFQIIFYNIDQKWLKMPGKTDCRFFSADPPTLRQASDFIAEIQPEGGTQHLAAIELALRLHPDVIFFLTDGGKPGLSPLEFEEVNRLNQGRSRIHCVQFRSDDDPDSLSATEFLRKLSADNHGEYVVRDVSRFDSPMPPERSAPTDANSAGAPR